MNEKVETENKRALRKIWLKKIFKRAIWTFVVLYCFFWFLGVYGERIGKYIDMRVETYKSEKAIAIIAAKQAEHDRLWKADNIGGKTPEETMQMFIDALKANDTEKAGTLHIVTKQKEEIEAYKKILQRDGDFSKVIKYVEDVRRFGKKSCTKNEEYGDSCGYYYDTFSTETSTSTNIIGNQKIITVTPIGAKEEHFVDFKFNKYTGVWKLEN